MVEQAALSKADHQLTLPLLLHYSKALSPCGSQWPPSWKPVLWPCVQSRGPDIDLHQRVPCIPTSPLLCCGRSRWTQRDNYKPVYPPFFFLSLPICTCLLVGIFKKGVRPQRQVGNYLTLSWTHHSLPKGRQLSHRKLTLWLIKKRSK